MPSIAPTLPVPVAPPDVAAFSEKQGVRESQPAVLEMTRRIFPHWPINVYLEEDLEIANDWHIIVEVRIPDEAEPEKVADLHWQWGERCSRFVHRLKLVCFCSAWREIHGRMWVPDTGATVGSGNSAWYP